MALFFRTDKGPARSDIIAALLLVTLALTILLSLTMGRYPVPLSEVVRIVLSTWPFSTKGDYDDAPWVAVEIIRLPRVLLATLCGMSLALAGATMQGVFRNPLVGPEVAGVSAGATLGGVAALMVGWGAWAVVGSAFTGGLLALFCAFFLAGVAGRSSLLGLVLAGVIVGGFAAPSSGYSKRSPTR
jgi:iron complex transport system permease protein